MPVCIASTDPRSVRTRLALRAALAHEVARTGDLAHVTVTAVTECAEVTRRTFYSHYKDIPDLVMSIEEEELAALRPLVAGIAATNLDELEEAIQAFGPCPGLLELLSHVRANAPLLGALLGEGGDPAFAERLKLMVREVVQGRAAEGLDAQALGPIFDYYLTYAISAEVGVLVRWLTTGAKEPVDTMAGLMTALMFVRPGDLYGRPISFDIPRIALAAPGNGKGDHHE